MKALPYSFFLVFILLVISCKDDDPVENTTQGDLDLTITGQIGTESLQLDSKTYAATGIAEGFRLNRLSFFMSDIRLVQEKDGQDLETEISEVEYLEFTSSGEASASIKSIPVGDYKAIKFNFGLTPEQDETTPADYAVGHPLANTGAYWVDWGSYIFLKIEGKSDTLANGVERYDLPFVFHIGKATENTREVEVALDQNIASGNSNSLNLKLDVGKLLSLNESDQLPLNGARDHQNNFATTIVNNAMGAFTVDQ